MERRGFKTSVQSTVEKLHQCLESFIVYTITFVCLNGSCTKSTVEVTEAKKDEDAVDRGLTDYLTEKKLINWCRTTSRMAALNVNSRGRSSLLRSVSMSMWAVDEPETKTLLQQLMDMNLSSARESARYKERWENEAGIRSNRSQSAKDFSWEDVCRAFKDSDGIWEEGTNDVDSIHIFTLANTIKRPILVVESNEHDDDVTNTRLPLSGLYLPTLISPEQCSKSPIVLAFHEGRFSPIVVVKQEAGHQTTTAKAVPLVSHRLEQFPIRNLASEESQKQGFALVGRYLRAEEVPWTGPSALNHVLAAGLVCLKPDMFDSANASNHVGSWQRFSETCHARPSEEQKNASEVHRYTAALSGFSGLRCSDPQCNEPIDTEYYPKCRAHGTSSASGKRDDRTYPEPSTAENTKESGNLRRSSSAPGKCSVPRCEAAGLDEYDGRCRYCYVIGNHIGATPNESPENHESGILMSSEELARKGLEKEGLVENGGGGGGGGGALPLGAGTKNDELLLDDEWKFDRQISGQLKCSVPICENVVRSDFNGLCDECFDTICRSKATDSNQTKGIPRNTVKVTAVPAWPSPSTRCVLTRAKCLSDGCHLPVDDQDLGLCKTCSDQQRQILEAFEMQKHRSEPRKPSSSGARPSDKPSVQGHHLTGQPLGRTESHEKHKTPPSWRFEGASRAKMCLSTSCDRFGDPGFGGYCSVCYVRKN